MQQAGTDHVAEATLQQGADKHVRKLQCLDPDREFIVNSLRPHSRAFRIEEACVFYDTTLATPPTFAARLRGRRSVKARMMKKRAAIRKRGCRSHRVWNAGKPDVLVMMRSRGNHCACVHAVHANMCIKKSALLRTYAHVPFRACSSTAQVFHY